MGAAGRQRGKTGAADAVRINVAGTRYPVGEALAEQAIRCAVTETVLLPVASAAQELGMVASNDEGANDWYNMQFRLAVS